MKSKVLLLICFFYSFITFAQEARLVKDINNWEKSYPIGKFTDVNGTLFFIAQTPQYGTELWKSDGTENGTRMVKDIAPGAGNSGVSNLTNVNGTLFFTTNVQDIGTLWKSDGTEVGTVSVKTFPVMFNGTQFDEIFVNVNGTLFFTANDGTNGAELWKSNGTEAGTVMIKDIRQGASGAGIFNIVQFNNGVIFKANDGNNGLELWKSDGTTIGTTIVKDIYAGNVSGLVKTYGPLIVYNSNIYFMANNGTNGLELWKSDGTDGGTALFKEFINGSGGISSSSYFDYEISSNGLVFFIQTSTTPVNSLMPHEFWQTDGTTTSFITSVGIYNGGNPTKLINVGGTIYFSANTTMYKSDGTTAGTTAILIGNYINAGIGYNNKLIFTGTDTNIGSELWQSGGTSQTTNLLKDIAIGPERFSSKPMDFIISNNILYFTADDFISGRELWRTDGTAAGTRLVKNIVIGETRNSYPRNFIELGGKTYFTATTYLGDDEGTEYLRDVWVTDGTEAGTKFFYEFSAYNNTKMFKFKDNLYLGGYLKTNADLTTFETLPFVMQSSIVLNDNIYFGGKPSPYSNKSELYKTDGVTATLVKDIGDAGSSSSPKNFTAVKNRIYFIAYTNKTEDELWKSDGTEESTTLVKDITEGYKRTDFLSFVALNDLLIFTIRVSGGGKQLWRSDGTEAGTFIIKDFSSGDVAIETTGVLNGILYFGASDTSNNNELWRTDGSIAGTFLFKDIAQATNCLSAYPQRFFKFNNELFFLARNNCVFNLWKTDGTENGTIELTNNTVNNIYNFYMLDKYTVIFSGYDQPGAYGNEIWKTGGTINSTALFKDISPGNRNSNPSGFTRIGNKLYFGADGSAAIGKELWVIDLPSCADDLAINTDIQSGTSKMEAIYYITATNKIKSVGTNATYDAGKAILLSPGFSVESGSVFKTQIDGCGNN